MIERDHIRNPVEWTLDQLKSAETAVEQTGHALRSHEEPGRGAAPQVRQIEMADLKDVLVKGISDFGACRTDVIFIALIYPLAGLVLARLAFGYDMLPLLFPLASGFALIGPIAAIGLYEMSRRREQGGETSWADAFGVLRAPAFGAILVLGLVLFGIFLLWLTVAYGIYMRTLGPEPPAALGTFLGDVFTTGAGWALIILGCGIGFLFAVLVLTISVVSFPMLLDRPVGLWTAVSTSARAVRANPRVMAAWGLIVAGSLVLGSLPLLLGLIFVMPVLGHATWHLYRKVVPRGGPAG
ncbi:DUF2189 domain-containing protein [Marinimicrococcus flavescens]|uniref:DUF2189 domain-containing protein n=1 Tax=Marinimicrococcus flavescens TaxID=3031815 RepID=A0AAP3V0E3_9PROT|nr:DUF2189 domain-containing protein [Marinimicrococcus flavescens]